MSANEAADAAYCAGLVRESDFDRYAASLFAPPERRAQLLALYGFQRRDRAGARADHQPLAGEIRLQWWIDVLSGKSAGDAQAIRLPRSCCRPSRRAGCRARASASWSKRIGSISMTSRCRPRPRWKAFSTRPRASCSCLARACSRPAQPVERSPLLEALAHHASLAHGLTSLIEAMPRHAARRQLYVPLELFEQFGVSATPCSPGSRSIDLTRLVRSLADEAAREFAEAMKLMPGIDGAMRPSFLLLALVPARLKRLDRDGYDPFRSEAVVAAVAALDVAARGAGVSEDVGCFKQRKSFSRLSHPRFALSFAPLKSEGAGKAGCQPHPMALCAGKIEKHTSFSHHRS